MVLRLNSARSLFALLLSTATASAYADQSQTMRYSENTYPRLGITIDEDFRIVRVHEGSPAGKANLMTGDKILSVEGRPVVGMDEKFKARSLVGQPGTTAHLSVDRAGKTYTVAIVRVTPSNSVSPGSKRQPPPSVQASPAGSKELRKPSGLDDQLIIIQKHTERTDEIMQELLRGLSYLPDIVKINLTGNGVKVVVTPNRYEVLGNHGGACYQVESKRVVIPEWNDTRKESLNLNRTAITILHELGHAYDHTNGRISFKPEFLDLYKAEEKTVPPEKRKVLAYFLEEEGGDTAAGMVPHRPAEECFASLFARKYLKGQDKVLDTLKQCFPRTSAYVESLHP
jgi:hypothetical protein